MFNNIDGSIQLHECSNLTIARDAQSVQVRFLCGISLIYSTLVSFANTIYCDWVVLGAVQEHVNIYLSKDFAIPLPP